MCGLAIVTSFYDYVRMYEISNQDVFGSLKTNMCRYSTINVLKILH